ESSRCSDRKVGGSGAPTAGPCVDRPLELGLVHLRAALDAEALGVLVQLLPGPPTAPVAGAEAAPASGRDVPDGGSGPLAGLAGAGPFLVHGPGGDLLGLGLAPALLLQAGLDVLV